MTLGTKCICLRFVSDYSTLLKLSDTAFDFRLSTDSPSYFPLSLPSLHPPHPPQGVWYPGGSQREVQHRRLRCEPDLPGTGVPQLRPVPALQQEIDGARWKKRGSSISLFLSFSVCPSVVCISPLCVDDLCTWTRLCDAPLNYDQVLIYTHRQTLCSDGAEVESLDTRTSTWPCNPSSL